MSGKKMVLCLCYLMLVVTGPSYAVAGVEVSGDLTLSGNGGILFPDGTTQTTASRPTWGQKIPGAARWMLVLDNEAVLDKETGLVWQRQIDGVFRSYSSALQYCTEAVLGGRRGFRLPTIEELATLVDTNAGANPYLPSGHLFIGDISILGNAYWSSTTYEGNTLTAWYVTFLSGGVFSFTKTEPQLYARCVRGGQ